MPGPQVPSTHERRQRLRDSTTKHAALSRSWVARPSSAAALAVEVDAVELELRVLRIDVARCEGKRVRLSRERARVEGWLRSEQAATASRDSVDQATRRAHDLGRLLDAEAATAGRLASRQRLLSERLREVREKHEAAINKRTAFGRSLRRTLSMPRLGGAANTHRNHPLRAGLPPSPKARRSSVAGDKGKNKGKKGVLVFLRDVGRRWGSSTTNAST